jgi:hypothetical protein
VITIKETVLSARFPHRSSYLNPQAGDILVKSATNWGRAGVPVISDPENVLAKEMGITISKRAIRPSFQPTFDSYENGVNQVGQLLDRGCYL